MARDNPIILALDKHQAGDIENLVSKLSPHVGLFKLGLEAICALGSAQAIDLVKKHGGRVFYDGKFCDIPNTVGQATKVISDLGVDMLNVHASCGIKSIEAAVNNKGQAQLFVVSVLTSISDDECKNIFGAEVLNKVDQFARNAMSAGADGLICSAQELQYLSAHQAFKDLKKMTPGIRPKWAAANDQARFMTPKEAIQAGADYLVIGRAITQPPKEVSSPEAAVEMILREIE